MILSRRNFSKLAFSGAIYSLPLPAQLKGTAAGPTVGLQTFSLRTIPHDTALETLAQAMKQIGIKECELYSVQVEPLQPNFGGPGRPALGAARPPLTPEQQAAQKAAAEALKAWRLSTPLTYFSDIRAKFAAVGVKISSYNPRFGDSDEEIDRAFLMTKALGSELVSARVTPGNIDRVAAAADKYKMFVGIQSGDPDALAKQLPQSKFFKMDIDIGDFARGGHDALAFVQENYTKISDLHLKDCKLNGPSVPFGEGDSHMKEILRFLKEKRANIPVYIDCDYPGTGDSVEEVQKCFDYVTKSLA